MTICLSFADPRNATDRKYDPAVKSATLSSTYRHTDVDENDNGEYYYHEYDDNNDGGRLPVPQGARPPRVDDLGRDSAAKHGRREHPGSPAVADFSIENPSSNSYTDGSGISGRHRGMSPASDAVDPLYVGLTAAVACRRHCSGPRGRAEDLERRWLQRSTASEIHGR